MNEVPLYSQDDMRGVRYKPVIFLAERAQETQNLRAQMRQSKRGQKGCHIKADLIVFWGTWKADAVPRVSLSCPPLHSMRLQGYRAHSKQRPLKTGK